MIDTSRLSFLGARGLARLRAARVAVIGAGGGGSHVVQQLAHLAVGRISVIDPDAVEESNVNRLVGSSYADVGQAKAVILARRFAGLGGIVEAVVERAESAAVRELLQGCDLVIGAVDRFRARDNVERTCRTALVPYIDIGLTIVVNAVGAVDAIGGQVATSVAGGPCLRCLGIVTDESIARDREEYVAGDPEPQVVSMNGLLASQAVTHAIALLTGFTGRFRLPPHLLYDGLAQSLTPSPFLPEEPCAHYWVWDAGWRVVFAGRDPR